MCILGGWYYEPGFTVETSIISTDTWFDSYLTKINNKILADGIENTVILPYEPIYLGMSADGQFMIDSNIMSEFGEPDNYETDVIELFTTEFHYADTGETAENKTMKLASDGILTYGEDPIGDVGETADDFIFTINEGNGIDHTFKSFGDMTKEGTKSIAETYIVKFK